MYDNIFKEVVNKCNPDDLVNNFLRLDLANLAIEAENYDLAAEYLADNKGGSYDCNCC